MKFSLLEKKLNFVCDKNHIVEINFHLDLLIILTQTHILIFKDRKLIFTLQNIENYSNKNIIYCYENNIYYKYQDPLIHQREVSLIKRKNLLNRSESYTTETQFFKMKKISITRDYLFVLTNNKIIKEDLQGKYQQTLPLKQPADFITYNEQIIILEQKELNFFDIDLVKKQSIQLNEWVFEIQNNWNYLLLSGHSLLIIIDLLNIESIQKINICLQGFDNIYSISYDLLLRLSQNGFDDDSFFQIKVINKSDLTQNFSSEYNMDGIAYLNLKNKKIIFNQLSNQQKQLIWSMKYKFN